MNPEAVALFRDLADRSPAEREDTRAAAVPAGVREEVESLLRFDADAVDPLHQRVAAAANVLLGSSPETDSLAAIAAGETRSADSRSCAVS